MLYTPPSGSTDANASYAGKNVAAGTQGSRVPPGAVENPQREIAAIIAAGQAMGLAAPSNSDLTQMLKAIRSGLLGRFASSGTPDAIVIAPSPAYIALVEGMRFRFKVPGTAGAANGGTSPTFQVNAITAIALKNRAGGNPAVGDLVVGNVVEAEIWADGTARIQTALAGDGGGSAVTPSTIYNISNQAPVNAFIAPSAANSIPTGVSTKLTAFGTIVNNVPAYATWNAGTARLTFNKACWADVGMRLDTNLPVGSSTGYGFTTNFGKNGANISLGGRNGITNSSAFLGPFGADKSFELFAQNDFIEFFAGHNYGSALNFPVRCTVEIKGV